MAGNVQEVEFEVAGTSFEGRQAPLKSMVGRMDEARITLEPDPENQYDPNAIKVMAAIDGNAPIQIGFVPAGVAKELNGTRLNNPVKAVLTQNNWYGRKKMGMKLTIPCTGPVASRVEAVLAGV